MELNECIFSEISLYIFTYGVILDSIEGITMPPSQIDEIEMAKKLSRKQAMWNDVLKSTEAAAKAEKTPEQYAVFKAYQDKCGAF